MIQLYKIINIFRISPMLLVNKISEIPIKKIKNITLKQFLSNNSTFNNKEYNKEKLFEIFTIPNISFFDSQLNIIEKAINYILNHNFDLLGSGITEVSHNNNFNGFNGIKYYETIDYKDKIEYVEKYINSLNKPNSLDIISMLPNSYKLIDWQRDFISGYRWKEIEKSQNLKYGNLKGVDVKVPWELGRMQHLILFPIAYKLAKSQKINIDYQEILNEYQYQVLDFIASNPRYYGIQWKSTMDVSIRMLNIIISYQLFLSEDIEFSNKFKNIVINSIQSHIDHSFEHIEWSAGMRGNHYLASISALVITCIIAQNIDKNINKISIATSELFNEILHQFNNDGSNFEDSIPYHYFSFEMIAIALIGLSSIPERHLANIFANSNNDKLKVSNYKPILSKKIISRISNILTFSYNNIINSSTWNIGDNDSGKFVKFIPKYHYSVDSISKNNLDYSNINLDKTNNYNFYSDLINILLGKQSEFLNFVPHFRNIFDFQVIEEMKVFKDFGLFLYDNENYNAAFKCGKIGQFGKGGHSHNDQLNLLLKVNGKDFLIDNGTYTYTASPEMRNKYRSTKFHNVLSVNNTEQNEWENNSIDDLFWIKSHKTKSKIIKIEKNNFKGKHSGFLSNCTREIYFNDNSIEIIDLIENQSNFELNLFISNNFKISYNKDNKISFIPSYYVGNEQNSIKKISISVFDLYGNALNECVVITDTKTAVAYGVLENATLLNIKNNKKQLKNKENQNVNSRININNNSIFANNIPEKYSGLLWKIIFE